MIPAAPIFVWSHLDSRAREHLCAATHGERLHFANKFAPAPGDVAAFRDAEICFGNVPAEWLGCAPRLRWMQLESVGFDYYRKLDRTRLAPGFVLTNLHGQFARPAAETALAGLLALQRGLDELIPAQRDRRWICLDVRPRMRLLHGCRAIVLGAGTIGLRLRDLLRAFECHVDVFARHSSEATVPTAAALDALLPECDVIACCLPSTPETCGFFDAARLGRLPPHALFVNVGRGSVVDERALVACLQHGRIGGAMIDVSYDELIPSDHPLWTCPRTILTQHTGGGYADELLDKARTFTLNLARYRRGEPLANVVNVARGY